VEVLVPIRVLSIPTEHVYVRHLSVPGGDDVVRLPDPPPPDRLHDHQWWPPQALEPTWVDRHHDEFDLAHLHFGFDARTPEQLATWVAGLAQHGKPLVYTVHDLRNPHHASSQLHAEQLDVLIPAADALVTLTPGAADVIRRDWGRQACVVPHPHVVPPDRLVQTRPRDGAFTVGVHLKSLRANMDPVPVVETLAKVVPSLPDGRLRIDVHTDVMTAGAPNHDPAVVRLLRTLADHDRIRVEVHDFFSDDELWDYLLGLDVSVLPYRFGTHSGWLEACHDLGTVVVASDCGFYDQQRPCLTYGLGPHGLDGPGLEAAVHRAYAHRDGWRASADARRAERAEVAATHRRIYGEVLGL
jgi:glycosyltransferase involved in cell wall biosynthesis